ncbi:unnamed protein product [Mortierella alpina]
MDVIGRSLGILSKRERLLANSRFHHFQGIRHCHITTTQHTKNDSKYHCLDRFQQGRIYEDLELQIQGVVDGQRNWVTNLANASALIYHGLRAVTAKPINWAGFYVLDKDAATSSSASTAAEAQPKKDALILGPFQGKVACTNIVFGRGVCGTAAAENKTLVVKDVHDFPGHIACDSASNSEIVVPLELNGRVIGVLDLDCEVTEGFDEVDQAGLEAVAKILVKACDWRGVV